MTLSVIIPVKDDADALRRCLQALGAQTRQPDEVIVVDNGSTDASAHVARSGGARVVRCSTPGIPAAAAHGFDCATGEVLLRLDADCIPAPEWADTMAQAFARRPEIDAFTGDARFWDGPRWLRSPLSVAYLGSYALVLLPTLGHIPLFGSNLGIRNAAWRRVRHEVHRRADVHDDLDLAFHLGKGHELAYLPGARMLISMRPFADPRAFARRVVRGARTVVLHWPAELPPRRWAAVWRRRRYAARTLT